MSTDTATSVDFHSLCAASDLADLADKVQARRNKSFQVA